MNLRKLSYGLLLTAFVFRLDCFAKAASTEIAPDTGSSWFKLQTEPYKGKQDDIFFVNKSLGFYVNGKGKIYRSEDSGTTWVQVLDQPGTYFRAIGMLDTQHGFAGNIGIDYFPGVTDETPLYETVDGGSNWHPVQNSTVAQVKGICAIDILQKDFINAGRLDRRTIIHAGGRVGGPAHLLRSLDGGATWKLIDMSPWVAMIVDVKFFDEMNGVVFAANNTDIEVSHALIVVTHDGGKTWSKAYESQRPFEITWKGSFPTRKVGYATIQSYNEDEKITQRYVVKTIDGGKSWKELPLVKDFAVREFGIGFANEKLGWVGTTQGGFETHDGGKTWQKVELGRNVNKIRILATPEHHFSAYAIGADVYKFGTPPTTNSSVKTDSTPLKVDKP